jgi:hypothetical protein
MFAVHPQHEEKSCNPRAIHILHNSVGKTFSLPTVSNTLRGELFREAIPEVTGRERPDPGDLIVGLDSNGPTAWRSLIRIAAKTKQAAGYFTHPLGMPTARPWIAASSGCESVLAVAAGS